MLRILAATLGLSLAAVPAFACPWTTTSEIATPSTTAAAQPTSPSPCPTCVVPDQGSATHAPGSTQAPS